MEEPRRRTSNRRRGVFYEARQEMEEGVVKSIVFGKGFGFIERPDQVDLFFHECSLDGLEMDDTLMMRRVKFDVEYDRQGRQRAKRVWAAD